MKRLGLTGGIASGKSTVAGMLQARGIPVVDADEVYHRLLREDAEMLAELRAAFGPEVFTPEGALDRKALGARVFGDGAALARLGAITHPRVRARLVAWLEVQAARATPPRAATAAIPLLFEGGLEELFDATLLVAAPEEVQRARLMQREGIDEADARRRIASQMSLADKRARADQVVENGGSRAACEASLEAALAALGLGAPGQ